MASFYVQKGSPYYYVRVYDRLSDDEDKRRSFSSKIKISTTDKKRLDKGLQPKGTADIHRLVRRVEKGIAELVINAKLGIEIPPPDPKSLTLSKGLERFIKANTLPGISFRPKTIQTYQMAVKHVIDACGDKHLKHYDKRDDNAKLLLYLSKLPGKGVNSTMSMTSISIITRTIRALWKWFIEQDYVKKQVFDKVAAPEAEPEPIPPFDMFRILSWLNVNNRTGYYLVKFMLLTATRPSSALTMMKERINFKDFYLNIENVKAGHRKKDRQKYYSFPLYHELNYLIEKEMGVKEGDKGRLFPWYDYSDTSYTQSLKFWPRAIHSLYLFGSIQDQYSLKQIRPTLPNYLINVLGVDIFTVQKLLDHSNIKVTQKNYIKFETSRICDLLDKFDLEKMLLGDKILT